MNKKIVFWLVVPIVLITAYLDLLLIGNLTFKEYIFQCLWEYTIFWCGYWVCEKVNK